VEYVLEKEGDSAAVIAEPVRSIPSVPRPEYWQIIRAACDRHGTLLIFDAIPHAPGRTGRWFPCEQSPVVPDMLVLAKGLGYDLNTAALLARDNLHVAATRALGHSTHEKNPVLCAAALAPLNVIETHGLLRHAQTLGAYALERMTAMMQRHPLIGDGRGLGLLLGMPATV
ncbi:MAG: aminotransferase class III-fold pyridoxal phosphate-dependent enzyme, partial [Chloroflexaceae bacterium]|nr:aminotransferase class III-fold pyridoxal phosphate-dependent enzyme [Chloroflexaceae bacterium]